MTTEAYEIVTMQLGRAATGYVSVTARCSECRYTSFTGARVDIAAAREYWIKDHIEQHGPGRAVDIEVDWEISAYCSVCDDGIGDIEVVDSEIVECQECGTSWSMDGTGGELADE